MSHAEKNKSLFRMGVRISIHIQAPPTRVWALLTDAAAQVSWNSTLQTLEGTIAEGERIQLTAHASGDRVFKLTVSDVQPNRAMTWSDGFAPMFKGVRTFRLSEENGGTRFEMEEVLSGLMLPMIAPSLPDFGPIFETYAADLQAAAETGG